VKSHRLVEGDLLMLYRSQQGGYVSVFVNYCTEAHPCIHTSPSVEDVKIVCCIL
jgi:hypothetical protein